MSYVIFVALKPLCASVSDIDACCKTQQASDVNTLILTLQAAMCSVCIVLKKFTANVQMLNIIQRLLVANMSQR